MLLERIETYFKIKCFFIKNCSLSRAIFFFNYFYKRKNGTLKIILNHFDGYSLYREKNIGSNIIKCGIGNLFENYGKVQSRNTV